MKCYYDRNFNFNKTNKSLYCTRNMVIVITDNNANVLVSIIYHCKHCHSVETNCHGSAGTTYN